MTADIAKVPPQLPDGVRTALGLAPSGPHYFFYRHRAWVRIAHWINALSLAILLMSGLNIFNAHPALYWGNGSDFDHPDPDAGRAMPTRWACRPRASPSSAAISSTPPACWAPPMSTASSPRAAFPAGRPCRGRTGWRWRGNGISPSPGSWCSTRPCSSPMDSGAGISPATWCRRARDIAHLPREIADHARLQISPWRERQAL